MSSVELETLDRLIDGDEAAEGAVTGESADAPIASANERESAALEAAAKRFLSIVDHVLLHLVFEQLSVAQGASFTHLVQAREAAMPRRRSAIEGSE